MRALALLSLIWLASCGADGAPQRPEPPTRPELSGQSGVTLSGQMRVGVVICEKPATC